MPPALPLADQHPPEPSPSNMPMPSGTRLPETTVPVVQSDLSEEIAPSTVLPVPPIGVIQEERQVSTPHEFVSQDLPLAALATPVAVRRQPEAGPPGVPTPSMTKVPEIIAPVVQRKPSEETTPLSVSAEPRVEAVQEEKKVVVPSALSLAVPAAPDVVQRQPETGLSSAPTEPPVGAVLEEKEAAESSALSLAAPAAPDVVQRQPETGPSSAPTSPVTGASGIIAPVVQRKPSEGTTPSSVPTEPSARAVQEEKKAAESSALPLTVPAMPGAVRRQPETGLSSAPTPPITGSPAIS
ncbi:MAG: hypothetical protein JW934_06395, partial [Anaerolineae bacterium]|nr:hypothetical protein [Anaerolineae bacterium]